MRLILRRGGDFFVGKMNEKLRDLAFAHLLRRVAFVVEEDESFDPVQIGFFDSDAVNDWHELGCELRRAV